MILKMSLRKNIEWSTSVEQSNINSSCLQFQDMFLTATNGLFETVREKKMAMSLSSQIFQIRLQG